MTNPTPSPLAEKFLKLHEEVDAEIQERSEEIYTAILALLSKKHHFQLGPPGIAKSLLVERLVARIDNFPEGGYFHHLLTKYTTDDELFGPADIAALMDEERSRFVRRTDWKLPVAHIAFMDEIFKGNSSVLNSLLLAMNERKFDDEQGPVNIPLITMFGASNELPQGEELGAMWDRLHIRHHVDPLQDGESFTNMLSTTFDADPEKLITLADIETANVEVRQVRVPPNVLEALLELRHSLAQNGISPTDRRWVNSIDVIKAAAWLDGFDTVEVRHTRPLMHMMWEQDEDRRKVVDIVLGMADPLEREGQTYWEDLMALEEQFNEAMNDTEGTKSKSSSAVEVYSKMEQLNELMKGLTARVKEAGRELKIISTFERRFMEISMKVMKEGFSVDDEDLPSL